MSRQIKSSPTLSVLQFVRAKRGPRSGWVYGYISDVGQPIDGVAEWEWIEVRYHNGIKPTTELFAPNQVQGIDDEMFDVKTEGQTALHSRYWDDKEKARQSATPSISLAPRPTDLWEVFEQGSLRGEESGVELSVILKANLFGHESYGWEGPAKIVLPQGDDGNLVQTKANLTYWRRVARVLCAGLNAQPELAKMAKRLHGLHDFNEQGAPDDGED